MHDIENYIDYGTDQVCYCNKPVEKCETQYECSEKAIMLENAEMRKLGL